MTLYKLIVNIYLFRRKQYCHPMIPIVLLTFLLTKAVNSLFGCQKITRKMSEGLFMEFRFLLKNAFTLPDMIVLLDLQNILTRQQKQIALSLGYLIFSSLYFTILCFSQTSRCLVTWLSTFFAFLT